MLTFRRPISRPIRIWVRCAYSTPTPAANPASALLLKVRNDMKAAMKAKDSSRLDVLRGLISEVTNAAKTSKPVTTDSQMLSVIRKRVKSSEAAVAEFQAAKREDLEAREVAQIAILDEYLQDSNSMGDEDITKAVQDIIGRMRTDAKETNRGTVMKALVGPGGTLEGRTVDKSDVARIVGGML